MITKTPLFNAEGDEIGHMETYINEEYIEQVPPEEEAAIDQAVAEGRIFDGREAFLNEGEAAGTELEGMQTKRIAALQEQVDTLRKLIEVMADKDIGDCPKPIVLDISTQFCELIDEHIKLRQDYLQLLQVGNRLAKAIRSNMK